MGDDTMTPAHCRLVGYPVLSIPEEARKASPLFWVDEHFPKAFFLHGTADTWVPYQQSVHMAEKVNHFCGEGQAKLKLFDGEEHGAPCFYSEETLAEVLGFIDSIAFPDGNVPEKRQNIVREMKAVEGFIEFETTAVIKTKSFI